MYVPGDTAPFAFDRLLSLDSLKFSLQLAPHRQAHRAGYQSGPRQGPGASKPPRLPKIWQHGKWERRSFQVPYFIVVAGDNVEFIIPGRNRYERDGSFLFGLGPLLLQSFDPVFELDLLGYYETKTCKMKVETLPARLNSQSPGAGCLEIKRFLFDRHLLDHHGGWPFVHFSLGFIRIDHHRALGRREHKQTIRRS